ncbi:peroxiredoxin type-2 [Orobanche gracilis]
METVAQLQKQFIDYSTSLYREGILDDQFVQLQALQDESNPNFVVEVVTLFFDDSEKLLKNLANSLRQQVVDFKKVDAHIHQFKGSSSRRGELFYLIKLEIVIGAQRVKNVCVDFRNVCEEKNLDGCQRYLQQIEQEYYLVKNHLQALFESLGVGFYKREGQFP